MHPQNPIKFPVGAIIRSVYSNKVYQITEHSKNGMCNLYQPDIRCNENWNACNNAHFVPADFVDTGILVSLF